MDLGAGVFQAILDNVNQVIIGKNDEIKKVLLCWISGGHVLLDDIPGTGKTIMARAIANSVDCPWNRVQFTPDLLPTDILGASVFDQKENKFTFHPGPIFSTIFLGDEINRATPKTQSAMLEAMSEGQTSIEGVTRPLDPLFFTLATQNPVDQLGTYSLPEAQLDRFMMKLGLGYPDAKSEVTMLKSQKQQHPIESVRAVASMEQLRALKSNVTKIAISDEVYDYIVEFVNWTRNCEQLKLGASPRASIALARVAQAAALIDGLDHVRPSHIFKYVSEVIAHRLILTPEAKLSGMTQNQVVEEIKRQTKVPMASR